MKNYKTYIIVAGVLVIAYFLSRKNNKRKHIKEKNIIIGDSQTPYISKNTDSAIILSKVGSEDALWKGGKDLNWLKNAVSKYPEDREMQSVVINIGTNGRFNLSEDIEGLIKILRKKFPNANLYVVQGSWGWGGNEYVKESDVRNYYKKFQSFGVKIIEPPIGKVANPHGNLPIYQKIGENIDKEIFKQA